MPAPNKQQQKCIDNLEGQHLVLAGPGTGKTFTIVKRIKHIIKSGVSPEKILCLTFTEIAAGEMKKRIDRQLNLDTDVNVYTYHSFCNEIIKDNPQEFELPENTKIISTAVSRAFIKECIDEIEPKAYRTEKNDPYFYIKEILDGITAIKQNRLNKEKFFTNLETNPEWLPQLRKLETELQEKLQKPNPRVTTLQGKIEKLKDRIEKTKELWTFYECYNKKMEKYHYIDFNDMISMVLDKFESDKAFLSQISNQYEYILVDEYQDTNKPQNDIVFNLIKGSDTKNVFVVGDDEQIIFSFQGARLDTIERFLMEFPETEITCLDENMRSTQTILDVSRAIANQDENRLENNPKFGQAITKTLTAKNPDIIAKDKPVRFYKYADNIQEYNEIVNEIEQIIKSNPEQKLSEIAILTRSNGELEEIAERLKSRNIAYELKEGKNIFTIKSVIVMYYYMQILLNAELYSDKIFRILLNPPFNINPQDFLKLHNIRSRHKSLLDCMRELDKEECVDYDVIKRFIDSYDELRGFVSTENLRNIVLEIGSRTGIFDYYMNCETNKCENIAGLKKLLDEAKELSEISKTAGLESFVEYLNTCIIDEIDIKTDKAPVKMNAIQLSTYHSSKGREYEYVYMPSLFNTKWESGRANKPVVPLDSSESKTEDEYKLEKLADCIKVMYVGMTRAKHTLRLSYYEPFGSRMKLSCFISNIQDMLEREKEPFEYDESKYWDEMTKTLKKKPYDYKKDFYSLVDSQLEDKAFSATSINTYLKCPRQFMYRYILDLDSKHGNTDSLSFGSAVHKACEDIIQYAINKGEYLGKEEFVDSFRQELNHLPLSSYEQRQIHRERGERALDKFYHHLTDSRVDGLYKTEYKLNFKLDECEFVGYIDRLDRNEDGSYTIIDYKTGSAKSEKDIGVGKEHEDYYNQIGLYKYFFEQMTGESVSETVFVFPEYPESSLRLRLSEEECVAIRDKFLDAISDIKSYKFEPCEARSKDKPPCKYCGFKEFCALETV